MFNLGEVGSRKRKVLFDGVLLEEVKEEGEVFCFSGLKVLGRCCFYFCFLLEMLLGFLFYILSNNIFFIGVIMG